MELDPKVCQDYLDYMRAYNQGKKDEASYHTYTPLIPFWIKAFIVYALVLIFIGGLMIGLIRWFF